MGCCQIKNPKKLPCDYWKTRENSKNLKYLNQNSMNLRPKKLPSLRIFTFIKDKTSNLTVIKEVYPHLEHSPLE